MERNEEAIPLIEEAMRIYENAHSTDTGTYAVFTRNLGLLHKRMRRYDLAVEVRKYFVEKGPRFKDNVDEVDAWLRKHRM